MFRGPWRTGFILGRREWRWNYRPLLNHFNYGRRPEAAAETVGWGGGEHNKAPMRTRTMTFPTPPTPPPRLAPPTPHGLKTTPVPRPTKHCLGNCGL